MKAIVCSAMLGLTSLWVLDAGAVKAADPADFLGSPHQHRLLRGDAPPGSIGGARLYGAGQFPSVVGGYYQPVTFRGPRGVRFAMSSSRTFLSSETNLTAGMLVGSVYRFKITSIPRREGAEVFPTIEVIDRTYPPPGLAARFPIVVDISHSDLLDALDGKVVTRVVYLEDPQTASPLQQSDLPETPIEAGSNQDALALADRFGRPVAILRMGSVAPPQEPALMPGFFFGSPPWVPITEPQRPTIALPPAGASAAPNNPQPSAGVYVGDEE